MTYSISCFVNFLISNGIVNPQQRNIYIYGFDLMLHTGINTFCVLIIGILSSHILEVLILLFFFCCSQSIGGGFHASTHLQCFIYVILGTLFYIFLIDLSVPSMTVLWLGIIAVALLWHYPLVLHPNKSYLSSKHVTLIRRSKKFVTQCTILLLLALHFNCSTAILSISYSLFLSALSRYIASLHKKNICYHF